MPLVAPAPFSSARGLADPGQLQNPDLGPEVLRRLHLLSPLPPSGLVAGQAVASVIDQILGTGPCVINDVDVFTSALVYAAMTADPADESARGRPAQFAGHLKGVLHATRSVNPVVSMQLPATAEASDGYETMAIKRNAYSVLAIHREGLLNLIAVSYQASARSVAHQMQTLVSAFDLNNVQVAVDIASGQLGYTRAFALYFSNRELRMQHTVTPLQSLLRYLKKRRELQCFGNDEAHIRFALEALRLAQFDARAEGARQDAFTKGERYALTYRSRRVERTYNLGMGANGTALAIGRKFQGVFAEFDDQLSPWLQLHKHGKYNIWLPQATPEALRTFALPHGGMSGAPALQPHRFWQLHLPQSKTVALRRTLYAQFAQTLTEDTREQYLQMLHQQGDAWLDGIENARPMQELFPVMRAHAEVRAALLALPFGKQAQVVRTARARMKRFELRETWGVFRSLSPHLAATIVENPQVLDECLKKLVQLRGPLVDAAMPLPGQLGTVLIEELCTHNALRAEGERMSHCVGGYGVAIIEQRCRIVSLREGPQASAEHSATAEWCWSPRPAIEGDTALTVRPLNVYCQQLRSLRNTDPPPALVQAEEALRAQFNAWLAAHPEAGWRLLAPNRFEALQDRIRQKQKQEQARAAASLPERCQAA